jgi:hypothetical protein
MAVPKNHTVVNANTARSLSKIPTNAAIAGAYMFAAAAKSLSYQHAIKLVCIMLISQIPFLFRRSCLKAALLRLVTLPLKGVDEHAVVQ